jgi:glycosyltransferase involved in cell wall biosynthesis
MNTGPLVSIIMNCFNGARYLREAIDSVFIQTYPNWELIFWDNASNDETQAIALSYASDARFRYFRAEVTTPLGAARNLALRQAAGEYIAFLDSDDIYLPETLALQLDLFGRGPYGMVYGSVIIVDEEGRQLTRRRTRCRSGRILGDLLMRYEISMVGAMVKKSVLEAAGLGFDENLQFSPDYDLFMRVAAQHDVGVLAGVIAKNRRSAGSLSRKTLHVVADEMGHTLNDLQRLYPQALGSSRPAVAAARAKLSYYEAVNQVNLGDYAKARLNLRKVLWHRWEYALIYAALLFPIPKYRLLRLLNR